MGTDFPMNIAGTEWRLYMLQKSLTMLGALLALVALSATPSLANHVDSADVTADCTQFTIDVAGAELYHPLGHVHYSITLTPGAGAPITIGDIITVTPDANFDFDGAVIKNFADML